MLSFSDVCKYWSGIDLFWGSHLSGFPKELTGVSFSEGWATSPSISGGSYHVRQIYRTWNGSPSVNPTIVVDWDEEGTVAPATLPTAQEKREATAKRFNAIPVANQTFEQVVALYDVNTSKEITGDIYVRIGSNQYTVTDLAVNDTCRDNQIDIAWKVSAQTIQYTEIVNDAGTIVYSKTENTATPSYSILPGTLDAGNYKIRVQSGYDLSDPLKNVGVGVQTALVELPVTIWRIEPKIIAFEPDGVAQNREQPITATWNSENQQSYVLKVKQNSVVVKEYAGTTATAETIPANTLVSGLAELELTLKYTPTWGTEADAVYASEIINFQAYGTPPLPTITTLDTVDTAFPTITWTSSEQYYFRLKILSGETVLQDTGEVPSELQSYTPTKPLDNGTYTITLTIKNQYGLYSAEASKTLTVSYVLPQKPTIYCSGNDENGSISVKAINTDTGNFKHCDLFRRVDGDWVRIAKEQPAAFEFTDFAIKSDTAYQYKARAIGLTSGYRDSDTKLAQASVTPTQLFEPGKSFEAINLQLEPEREETAHRSVHFMTYAGMQAPTVEFGEEQYSTVAASFFVRTKDAERLKELYNTSTTLCYRDNRGRFLYGFISSDPKIKDSAYGWASVQFSFTQTHYTEGI